jgi:hypothetical protein
MVEGDVEVDDVALDERTSVGNTCGSGKSQFRSAEARGEANAPWQMTSLIDVHTERGNLWSARGRS